MAIIALLAVVVMLAFSILVFGASISIAHYLISGLVVGALGRLVLPGRERIGLLGTTAIGLAGGMFGGIVGQSLDAGWLLELALSVGAAAVLLTALGFREERRR